MINTTELDKAYAPQNIEKKWYPIWEQAGYFQPSYHGTSYSIVLPPPNVTGSLHMGHGFQDTLMDALIRYHRMCGNNVLWQAGSDHAGIATQMVVERQLAAQNQSRHDIGREKFVEKVWQWKEESGGMISKQLRRMGASLDWSRERFTMDPQYITAVHKVFIDLYNEGLIYRGQRLVNWDPQLLTAISDLEVLNEETKGELWYIRYPLVDSKDFLVVATTRPETMLGDVAVAVHPEDQRYKKYIGKQLQLPLTNRTIPVIADDSIDPGFGTGCVKITPAHDFNDYAIGQRHKLPLINIFTPNAHLNENAPLDYQKLERFTARKKIISDLKEQGLLEKIEPHVLKIPRGDRSGAVIEPYLTHQWFMSMKSLAEPAIQVVREGKIRFTPENWTKTYFQWLENIEDWCISRQLWWGHRIPAWFDAEGKIYVGKDENDVRTKYKISPEITLQQDSDVLDTWFSAALWSFASLGWPEKTKELVSFHPTNVLVTGFDIIFFWVARMVMLSLKFMGEIPFKEVYVTGLIRDHEGHKMSKSKGNVLDPLDLIDGIDLDSLVAKRTSGLMQPQMAEKIEKATRKQFPDGIPAYGTDALRFTYCALASTTRDIRFELGRVEGYRNFCNKLWNAARFVLMNTENFTLPKTAPTDLSLVDLWIQARLQQTIAEVHQHFHDYRFDLLAQSIYEFVWNEFCDWYLELSKPLLADKNNIGTRYTLLTTLETVLRLLHPLMPFVSEEIWQRVAPLLQQTQPSIMLASYPEVEKSKINSEAINEVEWLKAILLTIRTIRSEMTIAPSKQIPLLLAKGDQRDKKLFAKYEVIIRHLAKLESLRWLAENEIAPQASMGVVGELQILIPLAGLIDVKAETARLQKEIDKLSKEFDRVNQKLSNANFIANAPAEVVAKERLHLEETEKVRSKLQKQLQEFH